MFAQADPAEVVKQVTETVTGAPALYLIASVGNLALAIVVILKARGARGAMALALLCVSLFLWDMCEGAHRLMPENDHWKYARLIGSALAPAFLFHYVLHFVRKEEMYRRQLWLLYGLTGLFALMTAGALVSGDVRRFVDTTMWNLTYLVILFPFLIWAMVLIARRLKEVPDQTERNALNLIRLAIGIGAFTGLADLTVIMQGPLPPLGHIGSIAMTIILALAIFRHRLLETEIPFQQVNVILIVAAVAVLMNFFLYRYIGRAEGDLLVLATAITIVLVLAVYHLVLRGWGERREQQKRLAMLGTMAASVAHEIKNPLASIKGAAQFVQKELENDESGDEAKDYLRMLVDETDRLNQVVENFLDYAKPLTPKRQPVELGKLLEEVVNLQKAAGGAAVEFEANGSPELSADPDLLRHAVSNILRNACEAAGKEGKVKITVKPAHGAKEYVAIEVEDNGPGIPMEKMEEIFQPFFTSKARGTGLGLAIAKRIMEQHDGHIGASNVDPKGARFTLLLPSGGV